jgi:hypothetical protein
VLAVLQVCGSVLVLVAFALSQRNIVSTSSGTYLVLNVVGSALLAVLALHERQWGFLLLLNAVWAVVSGREPRRQAAAAARPAAKASLSILAVHPGVSRPTRRLWPTQHFSGRPGDPDDAGSGGGGERAGRRFIWLRLPSAAWSHRCLKLQRLVIGEGWALTLRPEAVLQKSSVDAQDRFDRGAGCGVGGGLVDLVEVVEPHQSVERESTLHMQVEELWNHDVGHAVALDDAHERLAALHVGVCGELDHRVRPRCAQDRRRPPLPQGLDELRNESGQPGGVERVVGATVGDAADLGYCIILASVDRVCGS